MIYRCLHENIGASPGSEAVIRILVILLFLNESDHLEKTFLQVMILFTNLATFQEFLKLTNTMKPIFLEI